MEPTREVPRRTFRRHVEVMQEKFINVKNMLMPLLVTRRPLGLRSKRLVYISRLYPILLYEALIWVIGHLKQIETLPSLQDEILRTAAQTWRRVASGSYIGSPNCAPADRTWLKQTVSHLADSEDPWSDQRVGLQSPRYRFHWPSCIIIPASAGLLSCLTWWKGGLRAPTRPWSVIWGSQ